LRDRSRRTVGCLVLRPGEAETSAVSYIRRGIQAVGTAYLVFIAYATGVKATKWLIVTSQKRTRRHWSASRDTRRRVSDAVLQAFHFACDQGDIETAWDLLKLLEFMATRTPPRQTARDRRVKESLLGAYSRLWLILHPEAV
jgi:hypothetical protein